MLLLAEAALERRAPEEAARLASRALAVAPDDGDAALMLSLAHARSGAPGEAIDALNRTLRSGRIGRRLLSFYQLLETTGTLAATSAPERPLCLLAHYHRYLLDFDESQAGPAARYARLAIAAGYRRADAYVTLGVLSEKAGRTDAALAAFQAAIQVDPRHAEAHRLAAVMYHQRGDLVNEYRMISTALEVSGDVFYSEYFFDVAVNRVGDPARAAALLEPLLARAPTDARLRERLGYVWVLLGDETRAVEHYREATILAPRTPSVYNGMGWALLRLRRTDEAVVALQRAVEIAPWWPEPHRQLAGTYYLAHRFRDAIAEAQTALRLGDRNVSLHELLCNLYHDEVDLERAESCSRDLLARDPANVVARTLLPKIRQEASLR
jgi:Flp pilus assembly protein TadD